MRSQLNQFVIALRDHARWPRIGPFVLLLAACLPLVDASSYHLHVITLVFMYMTLSMGLNLMTGLAGLVDLGYIAFFAIGAYGYALLGRATGLSFLLQLPLLSLLATGCGFLLGLPTLRVRGDYLAIVTLGFGEIVRLIATNWSGLTNGAEGIRDIPGPWVGITLSTPSEMYYFGLCLLAVVVWFCHRVATSRIGWAWCALRTDEELARSLGHEVVPLKLLAFCLGANIAVICGAFFASLQSFVSPESFVLFESVIILSMVILGGGIRGNLAGVLLGAFALSIVPEVFRDLQDLRFPVYGIAMAVAVLAREQGLVSGNWLRYATPDQFPDVQVGRQNSNEHRLGLSVSNVSRKFGGLCAVDQFSFSFQPGATYGIIGHNGAGKTTLINLLSGVLGMTSGDIRPLSEDASRSQRRWRWNVARTFQRVKLVDDLNVFQNVLLALYPMDSRALIGEILALPRSRRRRLEDDARAAVEALEQVGFPCEMWTTEAAALPFGLKRKVELARALVRNPSILLLDEPLSGLAEDERAGIYRLLKGFRSASARTMIIVEHQFRFMKDLCDEVLFMESGTLACDCEGRPIVGQYADVMSSPKVQMSYFGTSPATKSVRESAVDGQSTLVCLDGVDVGYPARGQVLYDVELRIPNNSIVLVTGLNGAGKTTLLRAIAGTGTSRITSGKVSYAGKDITKVLGHERARLGIAYMPQEKRVFPSMRVSEHFELVCGCSDMEEFSGPLKTLIETFPDLGKKWTSRANTLSGGQQQMLAIVLALARGLSGHHAHSPLLLLDEPTMGLQPNLAEKTFETIRQIHERVGGAIVLTEQQPGAEEIATHHYHIEAGHLLTSVSS
ncbi:MAG: ATP-binding cassette domain-containing protein [bacterium]|nr:ATP-binding cassette domain-containing protein [bacterium]